MVSETAELKVNVSRAYEAKHVIISTADFKVGIEVILHADIRMSDTVLRMFAK
jgi:hypothetical protein